MRRLEEDIANERRSNLGVVARLKYAEEKLREMDDELAKERYKVELLRHNFKASEESEESKSDIRRKKLATKLAGKKAVCIANSSAIKKFERVLAKELEVHPSDVESHFECHGMEQTSNQITNMLSQFSDRVVIYAWHGLKEANDVKRDFKEGLYQGKEVSQAIGWFKQWLDS